MSDSKKANEFSKQFAELEKIVEWFDSDKIDLDEALIKFERGMELAEALKTKLEKVENKVSTIKAKFDS
jgi:exodeoxyribonuclease VII small subunit